MQRHMHAHINTHIHIHIHMDEEADGPSGSVICVAVHPCYGIEGKVSYINPVSTRVAALNVLLKQHT